MAAKYHIVVLILPASTTSYLQPCDVRTFSGFKKKYFPKRNEFIRNNRGHFSRADQVKVATAAYNASFTSTLISAAWRDSGLIPRNPVIHYEQIDKAANNLERRKQQKQQKETGLQNAPDSTDTTTITHSTGTTAASVPSENAANVQKLAAATTATEETEESSMIDDTISTKGTNLYLLLIGITFMSILKQTQPIVKQLYSQVSQHCCFKQRNCSNNWQLHWDLAMSNKHRPQQWNWQQ